MSKEKLQEILAKHEMWRNNEDGGKRANLQGAYLQDANLLGVDLDHSCFPLWCGGLSVHLDDKQTIQLLYHALANAKYSKNVTQDVKDILLKDDLVNLANRFHRVSECGEVKK